MSTKAPASYTGPAMPLNVAPSVLAQHWTVVRGVIWALSVTGLALAAALHPAVAERYLSDDGSLTERTRTLLYVAVAMLLALSVALAVIATRFRRRTFGAERLVLGSAAAATAVIVAVLACEAGLRVVSIFRPIRAERHFFFTYDAYLGWRHRAGAVVKFKNTLVRINADGLRELERSDPPGRAGRRILFLGDSQVFGDGVAAEDTFVEKLERALPEIEAINAGVIGYGTDQQLLYFERNGSSYRPDFTVIGLNAYDLSDNISNRIKSGYRKPRFQPGPSGELQLVNVPVSRGSLVDRVQGELRSRSYSYTLLGRLFGGRRDRQVGGADHGRLHVYPSEAQFERALDVTSGILARMNGRVDGAGGRLIVLFLPYEMDYHRDAAYDAHSDRLVRMLQARGEQDGYAVVDLRPRLRPGHGLFLDTMHFNEQGHSRTAAALQEILQQRFGLAP